MEKFTNRTILNINEIDAFLHEVEVENDMLTANDNTIEKIWVNTNLRDYINNEYPFVVKVKDIKHKKLFRSEREAFNNGTLFNVTNLNFKFKYEISTILEYLSVMVEEYRINKNKLLKLSFDTLLNKAKFYFTKENDELKKEKQKIKKELISLKELEQTFNSLDGEKEDIQVLENFCKYLWFNLNKQYFKNELKLPIIIVNSNPSNHNSSGIGAWSRLSRKLAVHIKLFNYSFSRVKTIFIHEMCHQAVTEISKISIRDERYGKAIEGEPSTQGHGSEWVKWMESCGQNPSLYDTSLFDNDYTYSKELIMDRNLEQEELNKGGKYFTKQCTKYELVKFAQNGWNIGMSVGNYTHSKGDVCTIVYKDGDKYNSSNWSYTELFKPSISDLKNIDIAELKNEVDKRVK